jgi:hypothetical protein
MYNMKRVRKPAILWTVALFCLLSLVGIGAASLQQQTIEQNTDRPGLDYSDFDLEPPPPGSFGSTIDLCRSRCERDPNCKAWTHTKPGAQGPKARCWLKNSIPAAKANDCCTSGVVTREFETNTDRVGSDYTNFDSRPLTSPRPLRPLDASTCQAACRNDGRCKAWTFVRAGIQGPKAQCYLKNSVPAARTSDCCTSGVKPPVIK